MMILRFVEVVITLKPVEVLAFVLLCFLLGLLLTMCPSEGAALGGMSP
jgi:hypothetical protein